MEGILKQKKSIKKIFLNFVPHSHFSTTSNEVLTNPDPETPHLAQPKRSYLKSDDLIKVPKTSFNPRFHPCTSEPSLHPLLSSSLYKFQSQQPSSREWRVKEVPLYVHENLHMGHFFNKTLKDINNRYKMMQDWKIDYKLTFGLTGKLIENAALAWEQNNNPDFKIGSVTPEETNIICSKYVNEQYQKYNTQMERWGLMTDFTDTLVTISPEFKRKIYRAFSKMVKKDLIFQELKPIYWSLITKNSVRPEEVKTSYISKSAHFIKLQITDFGLNENLRKNCPFSSILLFSADLWPLTSIKAVSINPLLEYIVLIRDFEFVILSGAFYDRRRKELKEEGFVFYARTIGKTLIGMKVREPLNGEDLVIINDRRLKPSEGTAISAVCPAHYLSDIQLAKEHKLNLDCLVDSAGNLLPYIGKSKTNKKLDSESDDIDDIHPASQPWVGKNVLLEDASRAIRIKLEESRLLIKIGESVETAFYTHLKSDEPIIVRSEGVWFGKIQDEEKRKVSKEGRKMEKNIVENKLEAYDSFQDVLDKAPSEILISEHGHWGIPLPIYYFKSSGKPFIKQEIIDQFQKSQSAEDLLSLPRIYKHLSSKLERKNEIFSGTFETICALMEEGEEEGRRKEEDMKRITEKESIKEEGTKLEGDKNEEGKNEGKEEAHKESQNQKEEEGQNKKKEKDDKSKEKGKKEEANKEEIQINTVFMEGKEQIWPNLLGAAMLEGKLNYKNIKLHGLLKEINPDSLVRMNKFSKENILLEDLIEGTIKLNGERNYGLGVDVLRWWVASKDFLNPDFIRFAQKDIDTRVGEINLIRKAFWELLRQIDHPIPNKHYVNVKEMGFLNEFIFTNLNLLIYNVTKAYDNMEFEEIAKLIVDFIKSYVIDIYIPGTKNLIISQPTSKKTFETLYVYNKLCEVLVILISPILPHNAHNIYTYLRSNPPSPFMLPWPFVSSYTAGLMSVKTPIYSLLLSIRHRIMAERMGVWERQKKKLPHNLNDHFLIFIIPPPSHPSFSLLSSLKTMLGDDVSSFFGVNKVLFETHHSIIRREDRILASLKMKERKIDGSRGDGREKREGLHGERQNEEKWEIEVKIFEEVGKMCGRCGRKGGKRELCEVCEEYLRGEKKIEAKIEDVK